MRASGMWLIVPNGDAPVPFFALGCARHGLTEILLMRNMVGQLKYHRVHLVQSFNTDFCQQDAPPQVGAKHWVDADSVPLDPKWAHALERIKVVRRGSGSTVAQSILDNYKRY